MQKESTCLNFSGSRLGPGRPGHSKPTLGPAPAHDCPWAPHRHFFQNCFFPNVLLMYVLFIFLVLGPGLGLGDPWDPPGTQEVPWGRLDLPLRRMGNPWGYGAAAEAKGLPQGRKDYPRRFGVAPTRFWSRPRGNGVARGSQEETAPNFETHTSRTGLARTSNT